VAHIPAHIDLSPHLPETGLNLLKFGAKMPSTSDKQRRTMAAAAHDPSFARKMHIPQSVAKEYNQADKGAKLAKAMKGMK
jgi:hypothetical protein